MPTEDNPWLAVIGRSLAYLALHSQELGNAGVGEKAAFLEGLGMPRDEVAVMLGTSVNSIGVLLRRKKKQGGRRGKTPR
jgi:hypothetical protein